MGLFDDEAADVLRFFTKLKGRLMPYIWAQAIKTHETGVPMMRAMVIDYANYPACLALDCQYMFGDNILLSRLYLTTKAWQNSISPQANGQTIISGEVLEGGRSCKKKYDYFGLPCFAKTNSVIAYGDSKRGFEYNYLEKAEFVIYEPEEGKEIIAPIYDTNANNIFELKAVRGGDIVEVTFPKTEKPIIMKIAGGESSAVSIGKEKAVIKTSKE